jgi:hypothetical protein
MSVCRAASQGRRLTDTSLRGSEAPGGAGWSMSHEDFPRAQGSSTDQFCSTFEWRPRPPPAGTPGPDEARRSRQGDFSDDLGFEQRALCRAVRRKARFHSLPDR